MVQDVPNLRAHVESRAQWPLWLFLAVVAAVAGWWAFLGPGHQYSSELRREAMLVSAPAEDRPAGAPLAGDGGAAGP